MENKKEHQLLQYSVLNFCNQVMEYELSSYDKEQLSNVQTGKTNYNVNQGKYNIRVS